MMGTCVRACYCDMLNGYGFCFWRWYCDDDNNNVNDNDNDNDIDNYNDDAILPVIMYTLYARNKANASSFLVYFG
jgi:hypothetical protein